MEYSSNEYIPRKETSGFQSMTMLNLSRKSQTVFQMTAATDMPTMYDNSDSFTTLSSFGIVSLLNFSHSGRNVMVFHCDFNENFLITATEDEPLYIPTSNK